MNEILSVSQINSYIKLIFSKDSVLNYVSIKGEVSNCKYHNSGHIYFTIKDEGAQLACVMFAGKRGGLDFKLEEGLSIVVTGSITVYERDGKYQMYAERIEREGRGALFEKFELLKKQLESEGLFDTSHKKAIPKFAMTIGVITAGTGAALQDIINITRRRNPYARLILYPAKVQGKGAAQTLVSGIRAMELIRPDVIIIGRGGGSVEDLFEFNDESLARAIYDCNIPVISAVGHEVDFTICDFVSDLRAPTPSAAAELANFEFNDFESRLVDYHSILLSLMNDKIEWMRNRIESKNLKLNSMSPATRLNDFRYRSSLAEINMKKLMDDKLTYIKHEFALRASRLESISPLTRLASGYSYTTDMNGHNVKSVESVKKGDLINIRVTDGTIEAVVSDRRDNNED